MLTTPLGDIEIYVDDNKVEYTEKNIGVSEKLCPDVNGRYAINSNHSPDSIPSFLDETCPFILQEIVCIFPSGIKSIN